MSDTAKRFRERARDCMNLATGARSELDRIMLEEIAADLIEEAQKLEASESSACDAPQTKAANDSS